jgi:hypothetical protein
MCPFDLISNADFGPTYTRLLPDTDAFRDGIPIGPRPPRTCQRLTTNRPIESAPVQPNSLTVQFSAGALHDWDLAYTVHLIAGTFRLTR